MTPINGKKTVPEDQESEDDDSSDIAESTEGSEEEDSSEGGGNESEDIGDEDDEDVEQLSCGNSDDTEYESSDVWSDEENDAEKETKEAVEAAIINDFERSLDLILNGKKDEAKEILKKILKQPSVAKHTTTVFLWENDAKDNTHLNKMGRVFVGTHKNLAMIDEDNAIEHYLQVVALAPHNDDIWFALGQKLVQKGDLDMAIYSFEQTSDWRAEEALISTHFLKKNYKSCLQYVAAREERLGYGDFKKKGDFLKKRIALLNPELNDYVRQLFGQTSFHVDPQYEEEVSSRLSTIESKILQCIDESKGEGKERRIAPIKISLSCDQSAWDIMTVFCDLFDRIQAYSQVFSQQIFIEEWECRDDKLIVESTVEGMVDDVISIERTVEHLVDEISSGIKQKTTSAISVAKGKVKKEIEGKMKSRRIQRDGRDGDKEKIEESSCDEEERPTSVDSIALREPTALEDVATYYLDSRPIRPLREGISQAPSRMTATPGNMGSEDDLLTLIRESLYEERYLTAFKALEVSLYSTLTMDCIPSRSSHQSEILVQVYRRWIQCSSQLLQPHQLSIHAFMVMYDEPVAMDYCMKVVHSTLEQADESSVMRFPEKRDLIRFVHKRVDKMSGNGEEMMKWLKFMTETMEEDEAFNVVGGVVSRDSIKEILEKKERAGRIRSLKHLSAAKKWAEIASIVESDSQWSSVEDDDELSVRTRLYTKALINTGREEKAGEILNRMLFFLLSQPSLPVTTIEPWIKILSAINYSAIPSISKMLPSLGYSLLRLTEHTHLAKDWKLWKVLHQVIKRIEDSRPSLLGELFNESLTNDEYNRSDDYDELPLRSLRFLVHAHDKMATNGVCGQNNGEFLKYSLSEFRDVMERDDVRETLRWRKLQWLMSNVQAEIYQLLHCAFGRYSKKRRSAEDHESGVELGEGKRKLMECAITLSMPNPIPEFDDKGTGGVDLFDLVINRFPSFIQLNDRRKGRVNELKRWIERGPVWKGELIDGETKEDKLRSLLVEWPHNGVDSKLESIVFYILCLHYHRQSKQDEARQFAEYFLSSTHVGSFGEEVTIGAWVILSYATIERMFKLYDDDLLHEVHQHIRPLRVAMQISKKCDATVPFLLAQSLYQVSTRLSRYFRKLPFYDPHEQYSIIDDLRGEAANLYEKVLEIAPSMQDVNQSAWDYQWLSYFFLAKLHLKGDNPDVVKAMDSFFEAACALQMGGTTYLLKIAVKNQKNLEPVEVHYQVFSTVWKYINRNDNPPLEVLIRLRSYTESFSRHGVVKPSTAMELYKIEPVISETVLNLSIKCGRNEKEKDEEFIVNDTLSKVELIEELKISCKEAFKLVIDRFPHRKAYYRLAEIALKEGDYQNAHSFIFKKIFPRKKKDDDIFEGVVEFSSNDIERSDSLSFHVTRSLRLGLALSVKLGDAASVVGVCSALSKTITDQEESYVLKTGYLSMMRMATRSLSIVLTSHPIQWTKTVKTDIFTLYKSLLEVKDNLPLVYLRDEMKKMINNHGGIARLEAEVAMTERRPAQQRKRKLDDRGGRADNILDRLGLTGRPPPPKMTPPSIQPRPITTNTHLPQSSFIRPSTPSNSFNQPSIMSSFNRSISHSSPLRPSTSASSSHSISNSPISDPNRLLLQMLIHAQSSPNANLFANLIPK